MHPALAVANYFIDVAERQGTTLNPMKLQKLVYFAHGWHLGLHDEPLIEERVQAWRWGPVIPVLYHKFKHFGDGPIREKGSVFSHLTGTRLHFLAPTIDAPTIDDDPDTCHFLDEIWNVYGDYTGIQLSNLTHDPGTPWTQTREKHKGQLPHNANIDDRLIHEYYQEMAE